jgi:plasmid stabilization system protein ParE
VRRVLLHRTRYHLYYTAGGELVQVLALWHARRGRDPEL